jgi:triosephosphate isomerase
MRKRLIVANWKMYKTPNEARAYIAAFLPQVKEHQRDGIVLCPTFVCIPTVVEALGGNGIGAGGQDVSWEREGPYTGEVSAHMLRAVGCSHVIIGHSERRNLFGETDDSVNRKLKTALAAGLQPIVCVGEVLAEREAGRTEDVLRRQCGIAFREIGGNDAGPLIVAYEPVWAIGTGKVATPEMAAEAHRIVREEAAKAFGHPAAQGLRILYGGSVKPENATALMTQSEIDGALVGGASLDPQSFAAIVQY